MTRRGHRSDDGEAAAADRQVALALAYQIAAELAGAGAAAVVLMGSFARGTHGPYSDLDIVAVGEPADAWLEVREELLISVAVATGAEIEASFTRPERAGFIIPGWCDAVILRDPDSVAERIIRRAHAWSWDEIDPADCDRYVAGEISGLAEEAHKLVNLLRAGNLTGAAIQRNLLATRLAVVLAVHLRLLYASENDLWTLVNERMGRQWGAAQARALGLGGEPFLTTCRAALDLYRLAAGVTRELFDARERAVIGRALLVADQLPDEVAS